MRPAVLRPGSTVSSCLATTSGARGPEEPEASGTVSTVASRARPTGEAPDTPCPRGLGGAGSPAPEHAHLPLVATMSPRSRGPRPIRGPQDLESGATLTDGKTTGRYAPAHGGLFSTAREQEGHGWNCAGYWPPSRTGVPWRR